MLRRLALFLLPLAAALAFSACADDDFSNERPASDLSATSSQPDMKKPADLSEPVDIAQPD